MNSDEFPRGWAARVAKNIFPLSVEQDDLKVALEEWHYTGFCEDHEEPIETCQMCEKEELRYHFLIRNRETEFHLWVGSECIKRFDVGAVDAAGVVVHGQEAARIVDRDRRQLQEEARQSRVAGVLERLIQAETEPWALALLYKISNHAFIEEGWTPKQMGTLAWRLKVYKVVHSPRDFKVVMRKDVAKGAIMEMEDWKFKQLLPYLSPEQKKRAMRMRSPF